MGKFGGRPIRHSLVHIDLTVPGMGSWSDDEGEFSLRITLNVTQESRAQRLPGSPSVKNK